MIRKAVRAVGCLAALGCACVATLPATRPARLVLTAVHGPLAALATQPAGAILTAANLKPGDSASGSVTLSSAGSAQAHLYLVMSAPRDAPGPNGGFLADRLRLAISDPGTHLEGSPRALAGCHDLGVSNAQRTFRFSVTFANGGLPRSGTTDDNAYLGSRMSVDVGWRTTPCALPEPRIELRGIPRRCARGDFTVRARVTSPAGPARIVVRLNGWTLATVSGRAALRVRVSDDWLVRRHNLLAVQALDRAGGRASKRVDVVHCFPG